MRTGVPVADAKDALVNPFRIGKAHTMVDGDIRQTFYGKNATVAISVRDKRIIQANPS
jgi:hypothetical protein